MARGEIVDAPSDGDAIAGAPLAETVMHHASRSAEKEATKTRALEIGPVLKGGATGSGKVGEEVTAVLLDGGVGIVSVKRGEERGAIGGQGELQADAVASGGERIEAELSTDVPERLPESVAPLLRIGVRPEKLQQQLAGSGLCGGAVEVGKEGNGLAAGEEDSGGLATGRSLQRGAAEERQAFSGIRRRLFFRCSGARCEHVTNDRRQKMRV